MAKVYSYNVINDQSISQYLNDSCRVVQKDMLSYHAKT